MISKPREPQKPTISSESILAIIDVYLDWCKKHRAPDTYEWYRYRLERFAQRYPDLRTVEVRPYHVQEWLDAMELSSTSKRNYCRSIKRCIRWANRQGYIDENPIAEMEEPRAGKREVVISEEEYAILLSLTSNPSFLDLLEVTWECGCRPQESLRVEARHVDLASQRWTLSVSESKTDIPRVVYLPDKALAICQRLMRRYPQGPIFRNSRGKPWSTFAVNCAFTQIQIRQGRKVLDEQSRGLHPDKRRKYLCVDDAEVSEFAQTLSPTKRSGKRKTSAELIFEARRKLTYRKARQAAPKYCLYDVRHTWMNRLLTKGVDSLTVAFLAGHTDPSTLAKVYAHLSQNPKYLLEQAKKAAS